MGIVFLFLKYLLLLPIFIFGVCLHCLLLLCLKQAIQKGNTEVARHAENAIRQKNQTINFLRMSARVDAVAARVQTAVTMGKVSLNICK